MINIETVVGEVGTTVVAYAVGVNDKDLPMKWALNSEEPTEDQIMKMKSLYKIFEMLAGVSDRHTARSYLIDRSLGDSIIHLLREGQWDELLDRVAYVKAELA